MPKREPIFFKAFKKNKPKYTTNKFKAISPIKYAPLSLVLLAIKNAQISAKNKNIKCFFRPKSTKKSERKYRI